METPASLVILWIGCNELGFREKTAEHGGRWMGAWRTLLRTTLHLNLQLIWAFEHTEAWNKSRIWHIYFTCSGAQMCSGCILFKTFFSGWKDTNNCDSGSLSTGNLLCQVSKHVIKFFNQSALYIGRWRYIFFVKIQLPQHRKLHRHS